MDIVDEKYTKEHTRLEFHAFLRCIFDGNENNNNQ